LSEISEPGSSDDSDDVLITETPEEELDRLKSEKKMHDAERMRHQTERLDAALAALSEQDRALFDRMIAGQQMGPKHNGKPLTLLQQATQAEIFAKELNEHGPDCWRSCCEVSCSKEIFTTEFARGCVVNWKPKNGNPSTGQKRGRGTGIITNADGSVDQERFWTEEQQFGVALARSEKGPKPGQTGWDEERGIAYDSDQHPDSPRHAQWLVEQSAPRLPQRGEPGYVMHPMPPLPDLKKLI
jgi:hypothetical protein